MSLILSEKGSRPVNDNFRLMGLLKQGEIIYHPNVVERSDSIIVAWDDVPHKYQKKILEGTMTNEDWDADWSIPVKRDIEDVVSDMLNVSPVAKSSYGHVHVFRKEYDHCLLKGCNASNPSVAKKMVGN